MNRILLIEELAKKIQSNQLSIFIGSGISQQSGLPGWKDFLKDVIIELGLDIDKEDDLISIAQYHKNRNRNRHKLNEMIRDTYSIDVRDNEILHLISQLPISSIWTTNYDRLIENHLIINGKSPDVKDKESLLPLNLKNSNVKVYKIHGSVENPAEAILTREDYDNFDETRAFFTKFFINELLTKNFLFIGYSFNDPNLKHILSKVSRHLHESSRSHYCIFLKEEDQYKKKHQDLKIEDLHELKISTLIVENSNELKDIFKEIRDNVNKKNVFISGAANEYSEYGSALEAQNLIKSISKELISKNYKIFNGFGLGVGEYIVKGVVEALSEMDEVRDFPLYQKVFPQHRISKSRDKEIWTELRKHLITQCRYAIFMFGNKFENNQLVLSNGMKEEFEIALENELEVYLIASTGYMTKELLKLIEPNMKVNVIHDKNVDEILKVINGKLK